jgi:hypothetical protein
MSELKNNETMPDEEEYVYRMVMDGKTPTRLWSIISLVLSIVAMALCYFGWVGMSFGILGLVIAFVSRKMLGYFDKITLSSIIVAIFAIVFSMAMVILRSVSIL